MGNGARILRLVVASSADVKSERDTIPAVVQELNKSVCVDRGLRLEVMRWETDAYPGFHPDGPQGLIDPVLRIEDCDVLIGIFWKRFGTPTKDSGSGTVHEFQIAYEAWKTKRSPQVMVYFNQKPYSPQSKEETDQWGHVLEFRKVYPKEGLWWLYKGTSQFEKLVRIHLTNFLRETFPVSSPSVALTPLRTPASKRAAANYFSVQERMIEEYARTFVGRAHARNTLQDFLESHERGYFVVRGGPGQGKTAFSCHLVKELGLPHHFISRTGGRADSRLILRSLASQLLQVSGAQETQPESLSELTKAFEELLPVAVENKKRVVIVIDALDELPADSSNDPPFLVTDTLPKGVFFVVTSRPTDRLNRLLERRVPFQQQIYELGPLEASEMEDILRSTSPGIATSEAERIAEASQGNPLYLRAVADQLRINPAYNLQSLPPSIEGFFRNATRDIGENEILSEVLGLLSAARTSLSLRQLGQIANKQQREIFERGIRPVQPFLLELEGAYTFYHARFHEFVTRNILYEDELRTSHRMIAEWLQLPQNRVNDYRLGSLAYHLFESGSPEALSRIIDERFLEEKVRRLGYAVLEDIELWTRALLKMEDPALVERCVSLVESLRAIIGGDIVQNAARVVQPYRPGPEAFRTRLIEPEIPAFPGLDVYVGVLPKAEVAADFFEIVPMPGRLVLAIGDAPGIGLKSAFVARFLGNLFHKLAEQANPVNLPKILTELNSIICGYDYFERVSMQCVEITPTSGIMHIANAGHPYPVHYSARTGKCDILPLRGELLHGSFSESAKPEMYEEYGLRISPGDAFVLITDGLTEDHVMAGDPYGYRFTGIIQTHVKEGARAIGEAMLDDWKRHARDEDAGDDVSVIAITVI
jgi:hypothetical protein